MTKPLSELIGRLAEIANRDTATTVSVRSADLRAILDRLAEAETENASLRSEVEKLRREKDEAYEALADLAAQALADKYGMALMFAVVGQNWQWPDDAPKTIHAAIFQAVKCLRSLASGEGK